MKNHTEFDIKVPGLIIAKHARRHPERSPLFAAHQTRSGTFVVDFKNVKEIFSWHYNPSRNYLGKMGVRHLALQRQPWNNTSRLIGIPVNGHDRVLNCKDAQVDIRMVVNAHDIEPSLPSHWQVEVPADIEVARKKGQAFIEIRDTRRCLRTSYQHNR